MTYRRVETRGEFARFFERLSEHERRPLVVATIAAGETRPVVDVAELERELDGAVELYVLTPGATFWLTDALGDAAYSVHSGWVRVYPAAEPWRTEPRLAPLIQPWSRRGQSVLERIVDAALAAEFGEASASRPIGAVDLVRRAGRVGRLVTVTVRDVVSPTQAVVEERGGRAQAVMRTYELIPGLPADRVVTRGQQLDGTLYPVGLLGEFVADRPADDALQRATAFVSEGIVTSAKAVAVERGTARLLLHPDVPVIVHARDGEDLRSVVGTGEVVTIEVVAVDGELLASFSDEPPAPAMSVLPGGPPWIEPEAAVSRTDVGADSLDGVDVTSDRSLPAADGSVAETPDDWLVAELERTTAALDAADQTIRELRRELRSSRQLRVPRVYTDAERQFRFELEMSYLTRIDESTRDRYPWTERYRIGPDFFESLEALVQAGGIARERIVDVCAEVLCGLARDLPARAVKEWRTTRQGPQATRPSDGAAAMRVRLQSGARAARRLRYYKVPSGELELDWVGVHDDGLR